MSDATPDPHPDPTPDGGRRIGRRPPRRATAWVLVGLGVVILAVSGWVGVRALQAYRHLDAAASRVQQLQDQLSSTTAIDRASVQQVTTELQSDAAAAKSAVDDPLYRAAGLVPFVGPNLAAVGTVGTAVDTLARDVMPSLIDTAETVSPGRLTPVDGAIPLAPLRQAAPALEQADRTIDEQRRAIAGLDRSQLVGPVASAVDQLAGKLATVADTTGPAAQVARLAPALLGADGPRTWMVVFQNPAEPRATGGIFGSFAIVRADQGRIELVESRTARSLQMFDPAVAELTPEELTTFGPLMAQYPADVNLAPDFPRAAKLFVDMYQARTGQTVDGVVATDPVVLADLLRGAPPVDVGDGVQLTADNLVKTVLSDAYATYDEANQDSRDQFLATAMGKIFTAAMSGQFTADRIVAGLRDGVAERRVMIWSTDPQEQEQLGDAGITGDLGSGLAAPQFGVFLNNASAGKLGYYLKPAVTVTPGDCAEGGQRRMTVSVTVTNTAPSTDTPLPDYVTGSSTVGRQHGLLTNVVVTAPFGGTVLGAAQDGRSIGYTAGSTQGRPVATVAVTALPGESKTFDVTVLAPAGFPAAEVTPQLLLTPGVQPWATTVTPYRSCTG